MDHKTAPNHPVSDDTLARLEAFDLALDRALEAGLDPACLHTLVVTRGHETSLAPQRVPRPALRPNGWRTVAGVKPDLRLPRSTPGTPEAAAEIFGRVRHIHSCELSARFGGFAVAVANALAADWQPVELHRTIDAGYWGGLADLYQRASDHAFRSRISPPPSPAGGRLRAAG